jgi:hypothetical protein
VNTSYNTTERRRKQGGVRHGANELTWP